MDVLYTYIRIHLLFGGVFVNILIAGGTGFVGKELTSALQKQGYHIYILTRTPQTYESFENQTYIGYDDPIESLPPFRVVINLAGESLYGYWTKKKKEAIRTSRIETTQTLVNYMEQMAKKPDVFISSSAVGYYGTSEHNIFTEKTTDPGDDFLANVVADWEHTAQQAESLGIRTVYTRFGIILGNDGGALPMMKIPVQLLVGGRIGTGEQWISWIHIQDAINIILFCIQNIRMSGPVNVTAPNPLRNKDFMKILSRSLNRPYWFPTPAPLMRVAMGEMSELITKGQYVLPQYIETFNYQFLYPELMDALKSLDLY